MTTIIEFITARLDEDEAIAREAGSAPWTADVPQAIHVSAQAVAANKHAFRLGHIASVEHEECSHHIARHDPARVLRQVAALRQVVEAEIVNRIAFDGELCCCDADEVRAGKCEDWTPDRSTLLRALASAWTDHPDYQAEWTP